MFRFKVRAETLKLAHTEGMPLALFLLSLASQAKPVSLPAIKSLAEFNRLKGTAETPYRLDHIRFMIDRKAQNRIYYIDSREDRHHRDFANQLYLSLEDAEKFFQTNTQNDNRRFILGWVAYQPPVKRWTYEFWDGDMIPAKLVQLTDKIINRTFFAPVAFKPNSARQEEISKDLPLKRVLIAEITKNQPYLPLNLGFGVGRLKVIKKMEDAEDAAPDEIVVMDEAPASMPPVAGMIFAKPTTPLSHLSLLARGWHIPNATIVGAMTRFAELDGKWVAYRTEAAEFHIHPAEAQQLKDWASRKSQLVNSRTPVADLGVIKLANLSEQRAKDIIAYGAKSSNLGEILALNLPGVSVPQGFTLPFAAYADFVKANGLGEVIESMLASDEFRADAKVRRAKLQDLRDRFAKSPLDNAFGKEVLDRFHKIGKGVFVRSSTNAEDLPYFSGAGLYTTVPNVKDDQAILDAIRTVWASVWNDGAYAARERAGIDQRKVVMAVLLQEAVPSESSGVMITANPFDSAETNTVYISAKRGLGIKVVDGKKVPEQIVFRLVSNSVQVLTRSEEDSLLEFDPAGGVKETPTPTQGAVLTDPLIRRLAAAALAIQKRYKGVPQDIEWAITGSQIHILQSRPYAR